MWFNVLKGAYPTLQQIDKSLNVDTGETGIERGSCLYQSGSVFKKATAAVSTDSKAYIYFSLMSQDDLTAGMAGTVGQGARGGVARITGLACGMPFEFETDQYDNGVAPYSVGSYLTVGDGGKLTLHSTGKNVVAQITKPAAVRWVNSAVAITGRRLGANVTVITARTLWLPLMA